MGVLGEVLGFLEEFFRSSGSFWGLWGNFGGPWRVLDSWGSFFGGSWGIFLGLWEGFGGSPVFFGFLEDILGAWVGFGGSLLFFGGSQPPVTPLFSPPAHPGGRSG